MCQELDIQIRLTCFMKRHKGCFNKECITFKKRDKYPEEYIYCPMCKSELKYVCNDRKCYSILDNPLQGYCESCLEIRESKQEKRKETLAKGVKVLSIPLAAASTKLTDKITDKAIPDVADKVVKIIKKK